MRTMVMLLADIANKFTAEVDTRHLQRRLERILKFGPRDNVHKFSKGEYKKVVKQLERFLDRMGALLSDRISLTATGDAIFVKRLI
ncbi:hypothetical protein [Endozoicomonas acroporae]|uniref:hypothetical protein n=1 Tax=Endozoicomonas acroporae TaxID=1701104 RepID=UPI003D7B46E5